MRGYDLSWFCKNKAFIHFDGVRNGKFDYGPRICINTKGEKVFELPDRDMIVDMFEDEDVAFVMNNDGLYALMNNKGEFLTDFVYDHIYGGIEEGLFEVKRNKKHGHIGINGKEIIPCMYDDGSYFSEGVAAECLNGKWGMIDYFNNTVIPFEYEEIFLCKNNLINAKKNGKSLFEINIQYFVLFFSVIAFNLRKSDTKDFLAPPEVVSISLSFPFVLYIPFITYLSSIKTLWLSVKYTTKSHLALSLCP